MPLGLQSTHDVASSKHQIAQTFPDFDYYTEVSIGEHRMTNATSELRVQMVDDEIIVTLPGSHYSVTYYTPAKSAQLIAKFISDRDDPRVAMRLSEFLTRAWRLANDKVRELGWGWVV